MKRNLLLVALAACIGCSSLKDLPRYDDAIDIRPERQFYYESAPCTCPETGTNLRDARTLRGTVLEVLIRHRQVGDSVVRDTSLVFLSRCAPAEQSCLELIPVRDVILPATAPGMVRNQFGNINRVRSYNTVTGIPEIRDVPVRIDSCSCLPFGLALSLPGLKCPERRCSRLLVEARVLPPVFSYTDYRNRNDEVQRKYWSAELTVGWRFGYNTSQQIRYGLRGSSEPSFLDSLIQTDYCYRWAVGLSFTYNPWAYNMFSANPTLDLQRHVLALYGRYNFDRIIGCLRPFVYAHVGTAIDRLTRRLWQLSISADPDVDRATRQLDSLSIACDTLIASTFGFSPSLPLSLAASTPPLTLGIGVGIEIPISSMMDLGIDIGYRSLGIGDELNYNGTRIPVGRRIGLWRLRIGVTF